MINYLDIYKKYIKYVDNIKNDNYLFIKDINEIIKIINKKILITNPDILYYASYSYYDNIIEEDIIYTYINYWLAIVSIFGNNITKNINNNNYILKDPKKLLNYSKKNIYIYEINNTDHFIPIVSNNYIYKYYIYKKCKFNKRI